MTDAVFLNGEFINLYSKENPMLNTGDICFALIFNNQDFHYPLIVRCLIRQDSFNNGLNKQYHLQVLEILETPNVINKFVIGCPFYVYPCYNGIDIHSRKVSQISTKFNYEKHLFLVDAFFVRKEIEQILDLRKFYSKMILDDLNRMISETKELV